MKTPMQEMLEWVRATLPMDLDWPRMIEDKVESLLDKEREIINEAFEDGLSHYSKRKMEIELEFWDHTCADGCCYTTGYDVFIYGEKIGSIDDYDPSELVELLNEYFETKEK